LLRKWIPRQAVTLVKKPLNIEYSKDVRTYGLVGARKNRGVRHKAIRLEATTTEAKSTYNLHLLSYSAVVQLSNQDPVSMKSALQEALKEEVPLALAEIGKRLGYASGKSFPQEIP
jgi:hypothetical protein